MTAQAYNDKVDRVLQEIPEEGPITRSQVKTWWRYHVYLVNELEARGITYRGESWKDQEWCCLLVMKAIVEGVPSVVFITERTPTGCMMVFFRQLEEGRLNWQKDKFA